MKETDFNILLKKLVAKNNDLKSLLTVINYIKNNKRCDLIPEIEQKYLWIKLYPRDKILRSEHQFKVTEYPGTVIPGYLRSIEEELEELKSGCSK